MCDPIYIIAEIVPKRPDYRNKYHGRMIGVPCRILCLEQGRSALFDCDDGYYRTSPVVKFVGQPGDTIVFETENSVYTLVLKEKGLKIMTKETMNIHQALVELKTLDKRIESAITSCTYVVPNKHSNTKINGIPVKEWVEDTKSHYQKIEDLMRRYEAIKRAVVNSNAVTTVEIGGKTYTVAEAIEMKNHGVDRLQALLRCLSRDYELAKRSADNENGTNLERRADEHVKNMFGNTDMKGASEEVKKAREEFIAAQTVELVDPIDVRAEMEKLEKQINTFVVGVDSALSVSNALTTIEVSY